MVDKVGEYRSSPNHLSFLTPHGVCLVAPDAILHARRHGRSQVVPGIFSARQVGRA